MSWFQFACSSRLNDVEHFFSFASESFSISLWGAYWSILPFKQMSLSVFLILSSWSSLSSLSTVCIAFLSFQRLTGFLNFLNVFHRGENSNFDASLFYQIFCNTFCFWCLVYEIFFSFKDVKTFLHVFFQSFGVLASMHRLRMHFKLIFLYGMS